MTQQTSGEEGKEALLLSIPWMLSVGCAYLDVFASLRRVCRSWKERVESIFPYSRYHVERAIFAASLASFRFLVRNIPNLEFDSRLCCFAASIGHVDILHHILELKDADLTNTLFESLSHCKLESFRILSKETRVKLDKEPRQFWNRVVEIDLELTKRLECGKNVVEMELKEDLQQIMKLMLSDERFHIPPMVFQGRGRVLVETRIVQGNGSHRSHAGVGESSCGTSDACNSTGTIHQNRRRRSLLQSNLRHPRAQETIEAGGREEEEKSLLLQSREDGRDTIRN